MDSVYFGKLTINGIHIQSVPVIKSNQQRIYVKFKYDYDYFGYLHPYQLKPDYIQSTQTPSKDSKTGILVWAKTEQECREKLIKGLDRALETETAHLKDRQRAVEIIQILQDRLKKDGQ